MARPCENLPLPRPPRRPQRSSEEMNIDYVVSWMERNRDAGSWLWKRLGEGSCVLTMGREMDLNDIEPLQMTAEKKEVISLWMKRNSEAGARLCRNIGDGMLEDLFLFALEQQADLLFDQDAVNPENLHLFLAIQPPPPFLGARFLPFWKEQSRRALIRAKRCWSPPLHAVSTSLQAVIGHQCYERTEERCLLARYAELEEGIRRNVLLFLVWAPVVCFPALAKGMGKTMGKTKGYGKVIGKGRG